jgi:SAM-dependent methyltransferase
VSDPRARSRALARRFIELGDPTGWFDELYREASGDLGYISWTDGQPNPHLLSWLADQPFATGQPALVVGCGLGDDAELLARYGFSVTAFDISSEAITWARRRFPDSQVDYRIADLLDLPAEWVGAYALVAEVYTLQVLPLPPHDLRPRAVESLARLVAPGGRLVVIARGRDEDDDPELGPWPVTWPELARLGELGLVVEQFDDFLDNEIPPVRRFRVVFQRPETA